MTEQGPEPVSDDEYEAPESDAPTIEEVKQILDTHTRGEELIVMSVSDRETALHLAYALDEYAQRLRDRKVDDMAEEFRELERELRDEYDPEFSRYTQ